MKSDFVLAKEELSRIGIVRICRDFYIEPKRRGRVYMVRSPAGSDKTPSLALYPRNNRFCDFSNGNKSGDCVSFLAYIKNLNQWQALKELRAYYGLTDGQEQEKQEVQRRILLQQQEECRKEERKEAFYKALNGEIDRLKRWENIYKIAIEKTIFEPLSDMWKYCVEELQRVEYQLDILTAADMNTYRRMKYSDDLPSDRQEWILDSLSVLSSCGTFKTTESEINEIKRAAANRRRCKIEW